MTILQTKYLSLTNMKRSLIIFALLLFAVTASAQSYTSPGIPSGTTSLTPTFRTKAATPDSLAQIWLAIGGNKFYRLSTGMDVIVFKATDFEGAGTTSNKLGLRDTLIKSNWVIKSTSTSLPGLTIDAENSDLTTPTIAVFKFNGNRVSAIGSAGGYFGRGVFANSGGDYASVFTDTTGTLISRKKADSNPVLRLINLSSGSIGDFLFAGDSTSTKFRITRQGGIIAPLLPDTTGLTKSIVWNPSTGKFYTQTGGGGGGNTIYTANDSLINDRVVSFVTHQLVLGDQTNLGAYLNINPKQTFPNINGYVTDIDLNTFTSLSLNRGAAQLQHSDYANNRQGSFVASEIIAGLDTTEHLVMSLSNKGIINAVDFDSHGAMVITDGITSKGITYANNYGANFTDRSLVDKGYVDSAITAHGGGTTTNSVTFNNSGSGDASGTTFNGGTAKTISYNTIGAQVAGTYLTPSSTNTLTNKTGNISQWTNDSGYITSASVPVAANPTASVGGSPVNGSATTFMRSDAAPKADTSVLQTVLNLFPKTDTRYKHDFTIAGHSIASNFNTTLATLSYGYGIALQSGTSNYDASGGSTFRVDTGATIQTVANFFPKGDTRYLKISSAATGANPTATAGTSAVNGSATTFMRSDAAPKVDSSVFRTVANSYSLSGLQTKFNGYVPTSTTVAGFALSSNVTLAALTATDATLTFSGSYTGATARTVGLNLGNANTWTADQTHQLSSLSTTTANAIEVINNTASTSGTPNQYSPSLHFGSQVWNTTATAANNWTDFREFISTTSGTTPSSTLEWDASLTTTSTPSYTGRMYLTNGGNLGLNITPNIVNNQTILRIGGNTISSITFDSGTTDKFQIYNDASTFNLYAFGGIGNMLTFTGSTGDAALIAGNFTIPVGKRLKVTEGTNGFAGQTTLVSGTKAITITGVTTSSRAFVTLVSQGGTVTTTQVYAAVCTSNTLTITALTNAGATDATDTSVLNYFIVN